MRSYEKTAEVNATERALALERAWAGPAPTQEETDAWDAWHPVTAGHQVEQILESFVTCWTCNEVRADPAPATHKTPTAELLEIVTACRRSLEQAYDDLDGIELRTRHIRAMDLTAIRGVATDRGLHSTVANAQEAVAEVLKLLVTAERRATAS